MLRLARPSTSACSPARSRTSTRGGRACCGPGHLRAAGRQRAVRGAAAGQPGTGQDPARSAWTCSAAPTSRTRSPNWACPRPACTSARMPATRPRWPRSTSGCGGATRPPSRSPACSRLRSGCPPPACRSAPCGRPAATSGSRCAPPRCSAGYRRLEDAQLALALVEVPALRDSGRRTSPRQSREELRLTVHRFLVQEAQRIHAAVSPASDHGFLIVATRGSLAPATDGFRVAPFSRARPQRAGRRRRGGHRHGPDRGRTPRRTPTRRCPGRTGRGHCAGSPWTGRGIAPVPAPRHPAARRGDQPSAEPGDPVPAGREAAGERRALVVDAETAGQLLGVTPRTARRLLHSLVEEGLAWPLPPNRAPQPGRPRQFYRLVTEKLERRRRREPRADRGPGVGAPRRGPVVALRRG